MEQLLRVQTSFQIVSPEYGQTLSALTTIQGTGTPGAIVTLNVDFRPPFSVSVNADGLWSAILSPLLEIGTHQIEATQYCSGCSCHACIRFFIRQSFSLLSPTIDFPADGADIHSRTPQITGLAAADNTVTVCLSDYGCLSTIADHSGIYRIQFPVLLSDGSHTIIAVQSNSDGNSSRQVQSSFTISSL